MPKLKKTVFRFQQTLKRTSGLLKQHAINNSLVLRKSFTQFAGYEICFMLTKMMNLKENTFSVEQGIQPYWMKEFPQKKISPECRDIILKEHNLFLIPSLKWLGQKETAEVWNVGPSRCPRDNIPYIIWMIACLFHLSLTHFTGPARW